MNSRRGVSLVELLLVMSAATVILTMSASLIHRLMHAQSKARSFVDVERTSLRFAATFRRDIHHATAANVSPTDTAEGVFLSLPLPQSQTIEYRRQNGTVLRILLAGSQALARDEFVFPPGIELTVRQEDPRLVVLSIHSRPGQIPTDDGRSEPSAYAVPVNLHVEAVLNRELQ